ncbi:MAG: iron-containing alcohol dehydrogenase family protein [cyanobacterium endosymbiont of Rhopalodia musculus]|uniref:iron-containing alcohol dehydrogenase family protein n=1 Tax=cyanobacterium endosymbiont of Epithemia clementina EcSB TaxID=3034674 RepID=UPI00248044C7|nr:iron-containing alcohol dehydrogenase family protein [cyanobacterium endosymbiont of Epithemia clementina EcSB]WGT68048.1 iron-containing alcohol dehydrogenase family protein [cyanobacterium endosymbiont of Epithemia clementina EcSB]
MSSETSPVLSCMSTTTLTPLLVSPSQVIKGEGVLSQARNVIASFGQRPLVVGGQQTLKVISPYFDSIISKCKLKSAYAIYTPDCSESSLDALTTTLKEHQGDVIIGVGGGKALDTAKLLAHQHQLPIITVPTSAATCAAWTALSNIYSNEGAFQHDVSLSRCPDLLILDYAIIKTASERTLVAGIGDAIAKWYEASVSSGDSTTTLTIAAVQQARVLRDLLFQKSVAALKTPGGEAWREVVDACVLLAGVIGGLGGANCRTVAAHAVHNGLTHIGAAHSILHGEKVAYGILVQLRLEEMIQSNQLAVSSRQQLLKFYEEIGLPKTLEELGLSRVTLDELRRAAEITCRPESDIHRLPFVVSSEQLLAAMVSTTSDLVSNRVSSNI